MPRHIIAYIYICPTILNHTAPTLHIWHRNTPSTLHTAQHTCLKPCYIISYNTISYLTSLYRTVWCHITPRKPYYTISSSCRYTTPFYESPLHATPYHSIQHHKLCYFYLPMLYYTKLNDTTPKSPRIPYHTTPYLIMTYYTYLTMLYHTTLSRATPKTSYPTIRYHDTLYHTYIILYQIYHAKSIAPYNAISYLTTPFPHYSLYHAYHTMLWHIIPYYCMP